MTIMTAIWESIYPLLDFGLILSILALSEIIKRYWISQKTRNFTKVLILSLIFGTLYTFIFKIDVKVAVVSVLVANWLYDFLIKKVIDLFSNMIAARADFVGDRPDDR